MQQKKFITTELEKSQALNDFFLQFAKSEQENLFTFVSVLQAQQEDLSKHPRKNKKKLDELKASIEKLGNAIKQNAEKIQNLEFRRQLDRAQLNFLITKYKEDNGQTSKGKATQDTK